MEEPLPIEFSLTKRGNIQLDTFTGDASNVQGVKVQ